MKNEPDKHDSLAMDQNLCERLLTMNRYTDAYRERPTFLWMLPYFIFINALWVNAIFIL